MRDEHERVAQNATQARINLMFPNVTKFQEDSFESKEDSFVRSFVLDGLLHEMIYLYHNETITVIRSKKGGTIVKGDLALDTCVAMYLEQQRLFSMAEKLDKGGDHVRAAQYRERAYGYVCAFAMVREDFGIDFKDVVNHYLQAGHKVPAMQAFPRRKPMRRINRKTIVVRRRRKR